PIAPGWRPARSPCPLEDLERRAGPGPRVALEVHVDAVDAGWVGRVQHQLRDRPSGGDEDVAERLTLIDEARLRARGHVRGHEVAGRSTRPGDLDRDRVAGRPA